MNTQTRAIAPVVDGAGAPIVFLSPPANAEGMERREALL
jgi:hypothetical protein